MGVQVMAKLVQRHCMSPGDETAYIVGLHSLHAL